MHIPRAYLSKDLLIREWLRKEMVRGQVSVYLTIERVEGGKGKSASALQSLKKEWEQTAKDLGYDPKKEITLPFLVELLPESSMEELSEKELKDLVAKTLKEFLAMQKKEGIALQKDLKKCLGVLKQGIEAVEKKVPLVVRRYEQRLQEKLSRFQIEDNDERVARELALFADRVDVNEEIVRLKSHLDQMEGYLTSREKAVGRTLEFLLQEIHRELNTLTSKVADSELVHQLVLMKNELGKMREQVQNIE